MTDKDLYGAPDSPKPVAGTASRRDRLARALRENLKRRKSQQIVRRRVGGSRDDRSGDED